MPVPAQPDNDVNGEVLLDLDMDALTELGLPDATKDKLLAGIEGLKTHTDVSCHLVPASPCLRITLPPHRLASASPCLRIALH